MPQVSLLHDGHPNAPTERSLHLQAAETSPRPLTADRARGLPHVASQHVVPSRRPHHKHQGTGHVLLQGAKNAAESRSTWHTRHSRGTPPRAAHSAPRRRNKVSRSVLPRLSVVSEKRRGPQGLLASPPETPQLTSVRRSVHLVGPTHMAKAAEPALSPCGDRRRPARPSEEQHPRTAQIRSGPSGRLALRGRHRRSESISPGVRTQSAWARSNRSRCSVKSERASQESFGVGVPVGVLGVCVRMNKANRLSTSTCAGGQGR